MYLEAVLSTKRANYYNPTRELKKSTVSVQRARLIVAKEEIGPPVQIQAQGFFHRLKPRSSSISEDVVEPGHKAKQTKYD